MATLPTGWEWDYDGSRWLYRYKPTGHVQYHFPNAGDEFPDYVDATSPVPDLAPEERLESQQQVKRHASVSGNPLRPAHAPPEDRDGWRSRMSATAQPVSAVWDDDFAKEDNHADEADEAEEEGVFQPENFMFLGPGTYTDVSPLNEEEEEAARRIVVGADLMGGQSTAHKGVSPMVSQNTTPMVQTTETVASGSTTAMNERAVEPPPIVHHEEQTTMVLPHGYVMGDDIVGEASAIPDDGGYHYEMYELPVETAVPMHLQFDPVGFVAEMPTEHTASARVETHPDPIELADNYVMAPIETEPRPGYVELPVEVNPLEEGAMTQERLTEEQQLEQRRQEVRRQQEERQRGVQQRQEERKRREEEELQMELRQQQQQNEAYSPSQEQSSDASNKFKIARKPTLRESSAVYNAYASRGQTQEDYQAYAPGQAPQQTAQPANLLPGRVMSPALQREASLNLSMKPSTESTPQVDTRRVPSVLKPARNSAAQQQQPPVPTPITPVAPQGQNDALAQDTSAPGVVKYPSVLRPARGKPGQDATKSPEQGSGTDAAGKDARVSGYKLVAHGQHPPSMTPAPVPIPAPAPAPAPPPVVAQQIPPQNPPAPVQQAFGIATAQPPAPIQRPYTTAPDLSKSNVQLAQQYAAPPVPLKVVAQPPYPIESVAMPQLPIARTSTAPYPHDDAPLVAAPYGPLQNQQPMRPASAMPVLQHQRAGSVPGQPQQMPIRAGPPPPGSVIVPAGMAPRSATAGPAQYLQQQRRQSYQPGSDPRQNPVPVQNSQPPRPQSAAYPGVYASFASHQSPPPQPRPIQRRATQDEILPVSPIRSRSQSTTSSGLPMETPSPLESRRGSENSIASQNVNNSYFAPTPGSQSSSSVPPLNTSMGRPPAQEPLQSPIHGGAPNPNGKQPYTPPIGAVQDRSNRHSMPQQQLANIMQGNPQGMTSPQPHAQIQPSLEQGPGGVQRSQSLRQARSNSGDVPNQKGPQSPTGIGPSSSSHLLTSIEEHDESQHVAAVSPLKINQRKVLTKPPPFTTPASPLDKRGPQQQFVQGASAPTPVQTQAQVPQNGQQPQMVPQMPPGHAPPFQQNVIQGQGMPLQQNVIQGQARPMQQNPVQGQGMPLQQTAIQGQAMPLQQNAIQGQARPVQQNAFQGQGMPLQQSVIQGQAMPLQQAVVPPGQQMAYGQAPQMHIAPLSAPPLTQGAPILQPGQIQTQAVPMQGLPVGQHAQPLPQQYQQQQQQQQRVAQTLPNSPLATQLPPQQYQQQQRIPQTLPNSPLAAQPGAPPPLQTQQQTSPTSGKENRKSWGKWFKSSGSKSAAQSPVVQRPQQTFPPVPIPQAMPGPNQPFQMQVPGQPYPVGFQGGQPAPVAQQQMQFQQAAPHPATFAGQPPPDASSLMQGSSTLHSRDTSDAASVSTISSDLKFLPSNNQAIAQAPAHANAGNAMNDASMQQFQNGMAPAPLFSGPSTPKKAVAQDKWTGKSPVDYSGGDWGDDDDEFS